MKSLDPDPGQNVQNPTQLFIFFFATDIEQSCESWTRGGIAIRVYFKRPARKSRPVIYKLLNLVYFVFFPIKKSYFK